MSVSQPQTSKEQLFISRDARGQLPPSQSVPSRLVELQAQADRPTKGLGKSGGVVAPKGGHQSSITTNKPVNPKKSDSDEALFNFLNSKSPAEERKKLGTPVSSRQHSRQSSTSSLRGGAAKAPEVSSDVGSNATGNLENLKFSENSTTDVEGAADCQRESPTNSNASADLEALADAMQESPVASDDNGHEADIHESSDTRLSSLELENRLLRNEIASLNQEMASVIQRAKDSQTELVKTKEKMAEYMNSASLHDQLVRELQARETDLQEALRAKDSQLAVLRVRLEESDRVITEHKRETENLQTERDRILKDQSSVSGMHSQTLDTMRHKLLEMENALTREQQTHKKYQQETSERQGRLEQEQMALADALTSAEKKLAEEKGKASEAYSQLKTVKATLDATRLEMAEYKEKASRILQSKERLIASLREGSGVSGITEGVSSLEYDSMKQERDMMREELQQSKMTLDHLRMEIQDLEVQLQQESDTAQDTIRSLETSLAEEKHRRQDVEQELLSQKQELQYAIDELHRHKVAFQTRISDREAEIERLRNQLTTKSISSTSESELESRVRALTESLIQKQTILEALSTEKNSLILQLERLGQQYRDVENSLMRSTIASVNTDHDDDVRQRLPTFMREGAADTEVTRRMKRYVNTIDKFSIRLGVFLRRYPIARVFVIVYMALLHLWVMIVLMTYQPEIHGKDHLPDHR